MIKFIFLFIAEAQPKRTCIMGIHIHLLHPIHEIKIPWGLFQLLLSNNV